MTDSEAALPACRHCGDALVGEGTSPYGWKHEHGLYRCQHTVTYGHNAAHPDIPCEPGIVNACKCTYAPDEQPKASSDDCQICTNDLGHCCRHDDDCAEVHGASND